MCSKAKTKIIIFAASENADLFERIASLRYEVWHQTGFKCDFVSPDQKWIDSADQSGLQFAAMWGEELVGAARCHVYSSLDDVPQASWFSNLAEQPKTPLGFFSRLVIATPYQRKGISGMLDEARMKFVREQGARSILSDVPEYRIASMQRRGWSLIKELELGLVFPETKWAGMYMKL